MTFGVFHQAFRYTWAALDVAKDLSAFLDGNGREEILGYLGFRRIDADETSSIS
jgi:hypothetical protein